MWMNHWVSFYEKFMTSVSEKCEGHARGSVITWFQWTCRADLSWDTRSFGNAKADTAAGESPRSLRLGPQVWELTLQQHLTTDDYWYVWQYIQFDSVQESNTANRVWNNAEKISAEAEHACHRAVRNLHECPTSCYWAVLWKSHNWQWRHHLRSRFHQRCLCMVLLCMQK